MEINTLIIVVTFNSEAFIEKCLGSIMSSRFNRWFLVVLDNNSKDLTINKVNQFVSSSKKLNSANFKLIKLNKNIGFAAAVNHVVHLQNQRNLTSRPEPATQIEYLILLNPDLYLEETALNNLIMPFEKNPYKDSKRNAGAVGGIIFDYAGKSIQHAGGNFKDNFLTFHSRQGEVASDMAIPYWTHSKGSGVFLEEAQYVTGALFATKLEYFRSLGGFDPGYKPLYFEELDYCLKLKKLSLKIFVSPNSTARHFEGGSVEKFSSKFYKYYHKNRIRCAIINYSFRDFFMLFTREELRWFKTAAAKEQNRALLYAYFYNLLFLACNLIVKIRNYLIISKLIFF
ncbi:MAG: glycosyltransferase family 2 protein [Actinobacteria bacterium]|nr:glycosyltransferase family 2 protein [Actinomycetota bacterium]